MLSLSLLLITAVVDVIVCCYGQTHFQSIIAVGGVAIVFVVDTVVGAIVGFFPAKVAIVVVIAAAAVIDIHL